MTATATKTTNDLPLIEALEVWWDANESDDPRTPELWAPILAAAVAHATSEGTKDAEERACDPYNPSGGEYEPGSDEAYLNAITKDEILKGIGLSDLEERGFDAGDIWDELVTPWCTAFEAAVEATFARG